MLLARISNPVMAKDSRSHAPIHMLRAVHAIARMQALSVETVRSAGAASCANGSGGLSHRRQD